MENNQSSYNFWTWIVAILLALILLWMLLTGRGPSSACCGVSTATPVEEVAATVAPVATESFSFNASCQDFSHTGDGSVLSWFAQSDTLKSILCTASGITASGDIQNVVLEGTVDSDETRVKIGDDAQAHFGTDVLVDNRITVMMAEEPMAAMELPPEAAKLYFRTASVTQPSDNGETLAPIIAWLNNHPDATAVISGYHDPRGSLETNQRLAKGRAQTTSDALVAAGIDVSRIEMRKPMATEGDGNLAEARRVEVTVE